MLHPLYHPAKLRSHQSIRLCTCHPNGIFSLHGIQLEQLRCRSRGTGSAVHSATVLSLSEHVVTVKTVSSADAGFKADDCGEEEMGTGHFDGRVTRTSREGLGGCDECGQHDGGIMDWSCGVVVVEFLCLDECCVHH